MGLALPPRGLSTSRCSSRRAAASENQNGHLSLRLGSAPEYDPRCRAPSCTLSRGFWSPSATQPSRSTTPGLLPFRVTLRPRAYHAPRRFTPSTASLVLFQPGALSGSHPSELDLTEVAEHLSVPAVPLAIGHAGPLSTLLARSSVLRAEARSQPRFRACPAVGWGSRTWSLATDLRASWLSWASPPWGSPLPCADLRGSRAIRCRLPRGPACRPGAL